MCLVHIYSLICSERIGVMMEGVPVYTWELDEWERCASINNFAYTLL